MVRILAGNTYGSGNGSENTRGNAKDPAACDRAAAGPTAPAKGLMLAGMEYQD